MKILFHAEDTPGLPPPIRMLHSDAARAAILEGLPECDRWGAVHKGLGDTDRPNPFSRRLGSAGPNSSEVAEDEEEQKEEDDDTESSSLAPSRQVASSQHSRKRAAPPSENPAPATRAQRRCPLASSGVDK